MFNNDYKFCVVGNDTTAVVILMLLIEAYKIEKINISITCIYDSSIPMINKSESTSLKTSSLLRNMTNFLFQDELPEIDGTFKFGTKYINFKDTDFYQNYYNSHLALQMDSSKFIEIVFKKTKEIYNDLVNIFYDNVKCIKSDLDGVIVETEHEELKYDYVFDCRGFPTKDELKTDAYDCSFEIPVNSMISYSEEKHYSEMYTDCTATKDGWMFGIPLRTRKTFGYVYNNQITPKEDAIKNFRELKNIPDNIELQFSSWNSFFKKQAYDKNILSLGNRLFFTEPFNQFGTGADIYFLRITTIFLRTLFFNNNNNDVLNIISEDRTEKTITNSLYTDEIRNLAIINSSALYQSSTIIDSEFWKYAKDITTKNLLKIPKESLKKLQEEEKNIFGDNEIVQPLF